MYHLIFKENSPSSSLKDLAVALIGTASIFLWAAPAYSTNNEINTDSIFKQLFTNSTDIFAGSTTIFSTQIPRNIPCKELEATLFAASSILAAPVHHESKLQCLDQQDKNELDKNEQNKNMHKLELHFTAPKNKKTPSSISSYLWQIEHCPEKNQTCTEIKALPFKVFPNDLLLPLKKWAEQHIIRLDDPTGLLASFFDHSGITYQFTTVPVLQYGNEYGNEHGNEHGDNNSVLTLLGREEKNQEIMGEPLDKTFDKTFDKTLDKTLNEALSYGPVILFQRNASNIESTMKSALAQLPAVLQTREKNNILIRTTLPVLPYLQESPFAQSLLLELFELSQTPH